MRTTIALVIALVAGGAAPAKPASRPAKPLTYAELRAENEKLKAEVERLKKDLEEAKPKPTTQKIAVGMPLKEAERIAGYPGNLISDDGEEKAYKLNVAEENGGSYVPLVRYIVYVGKSGKIMRLDREVLPAAPLPRAIEVR